MTVERATSRPLRALWLVVGLWIAGRSTAIIYTWPIAVSQLVTTPTHPTRRSIAPAQAVVEFAEFSLAEQSHRALLMSRAIPRPTLPASAVSALPIALPDLDPGETDEKPEAFERMPIGSITPITAIVSAQSPPLVAMGGLPVAPTPLFPVRRWSASTWLLARSGGSASLASAGQLGGSQAGARVDYVLNHGLFLTSRISSPLNVPSGREATLGLGIRHGALGLILEQRLAVDGHGKSRPSATVYGGFSETKLPADFRLDGYGQAGLVSRDAFADGALRVERMVAERGSARLSLGGGVWGAAQPGVARVDVGPQIVARVPLAGRLFRASAEWRQRVAGHANPGSGPSFTLGADF